MATIQYDAKTGQKLAAGASTTDALGNTYKQGTDFAPTNTGNGPSAKVLFNAQTGAQLAPGAKTTDAMGNTFTQGQAVGTPANVATPTIPPTAPKDAVVAPPNATNPAPVAPSPAPASPSSNIVGSQYYDQKTGALNQSGQAYQAALAATKASGVAAPTTAGQAAPTINGSIAPEPADTSNIDTALANDKGYQKLLADQQEYNNVTQHESLVDTYNDLTKKAGIPSIDTELLNTKKIIDGTEDDIRNEVQAVSGFATDSQVLALASARNKTLIQNYNNLLDTKQMAMDNIKTMIGLAQQDQETAQQSVIAKMGIDEKLMDYRDKFVNAAKEAYNNVISSNGYDGLYKSLQATGDPSTIAKAEQTLGLAPGQLQKLAAQPNLDMELKQLQVQNAKLSNTKAGLDIQKGKQDLTGTGSGSNSILAPYVKTSYDGTQYADLSSLTPSDKAKYAQIAQANGVKPILDAGTAGKISAISVSKENLKNIENSLTSQNILNDTQTPSQQGITNSVKSFLGNADIKSFNAWRTAVINNVQALAGGQGSGLRINQAEIDTALKNDLPVVTGANADNLSSAKAKIAKLNSQLDTWTKQTLGGGNTATESNSSAPPKLLQSTEIPSGYYQASDGLLYKK